MYNYNENIMLLLLTNLLYKYHAGISLVLFQNET